MSDIVLWQIRDGEYQICALGSEERCQVMEYLERQSKDDPAEYAKVQARLDQVAHNGPPHNREQCNGLGNECFELKTTKSRITCFWDAGRLILCSTMFMKQGQKTPKKFIEKLYADKERYEAQKKAEGGMK